MEDEQAKGSHSPNECDSGFTLMEEGQQLSNMNTRLPSRANKIRNCVRKVAPVVFCVIIIFSVVGFVSQRRIPLTLLQDSRARCLDGTPPGFYFDPSTDRLDGENSRKWMFFLDGGGECSSVKECLPKLESSLGSSEYFPHSKQDLPKFASWQESVNPGFHNWNRVFLMYCSQDLWTGKHGAVKAYSEDLHPDSDLLLRFHGHRILKEVLNHFDKDLLQATDIVLSGESAGGIGVFNNIDYVEKRYGESAGKSKRHRTSVVAAPIAGLYFYAYPYEGLGHTGSGLSDFRKPAWKSHYEFWDSRVNFECSESLPRHTCLLPNITFPFITAPVFVAEAQTDRVQLIAHDWVDKSSVQHREPHAMAYLAEWRKNMTQALHFHALGKDSDDWEAAQGNTTATANQDLKVDVLSRKSKLQRGFFFPACLIHTEFTNGKGPWIGDYSYATAFQEWYYQDRSFHLEDGPDVGLMEGNCAGQK